MREGMMLNWIAEKWWRTALFVAAILFAITLPEWIPSDPCPCGRNYPNTVQDDQGLWWEE